MSGSAEKTEESGFEKSLDWVLTPDPDPKVE